MRTRVIHLINPKTDSFTTRPLYMNRALYSPLAGLLAVAAVIPRDQYEVVLTDENIELIDFDLRSALFVGFAATMAESDSPRPCIIGYGSRQSPPSGSCISTPKLRRQHCIGSNEDFDRG